MRIAIALLAVLALTGCAAAEPAATLTSAEAIAKYQPIFDDVSAAVKEAYPGHVYTVDNVHDSVGTGGDCTFWISDLGNDSTDMDDRGEYLALIGPLITEFGTLRQLD